MNGAPVTGQERALRVRGFAQAKQMARAVNITLLKLTRAEAQPAGCPLEIGFGQIYPAAGGAAPGAASKAGETEALPKTFH